MNEEGVSELLGYAILIGVAMTAIICIASGSAGMISSSAGGTGLSEAALSIKSFANAAMEVVRENNSFFTIAEVQTPPGYELIALDADDDMARIAIVCEGSVLYDVRLGSLRLQSPFRAVVCEGDAVFVNDSGSTEIARRPSIFFAGREGGTALYVYLASIATNSRVISGGSTALLELKAEGRESGRVSVNPAATTTIYIWSQEPEGWSTALQEKGFTVTCDGRSVTATKGGISTVCFDRATLRLALE